MRWNKILFRLLIVAIFFTATKCNDKGESVTPGQPVINEGGQQLKDTIKLGELFPLKIWRSEEIYDSVSGQMLKLCLDSVDDRRYLAPSCFEDLVALRPPAICYFTFMDTIKVIIYSDCGPQSCFTKHPYPTAVDTLGYRICMQVLEPFADTTGIWNSQGANIPDSLYKAIIKITKK